MPTTGSNNHPMTDPYHAWLDAELVLDHEANPEQFEKITWPQYSSPNCQTSPLTEQSDSSPEAENGLAD